MQMSANEDVQDELRNLVARWTLPECFYVVDESGPCDVAVKLPADSGLYAFWNNKGELIYIGKADDLRARIRQHHIARKAVCNGFGALSFAVFPAQWIDAMEATLIAHLRPELNVGSVRKALVSEKSLRLTLYQLRRHPELPLLPDYEIGKIEPQSECRWAIKRELEQQGLITLLRLKLFGKPIQPLPVVAA